MGQPIETSNAPPPRAQPAGSSEPLKAGAHAPTSLPARPLGLSLLWAGGAVGAFHLAYGFSGLSWLVFVYLLCVLQLAQAATSRQAFYLGLGVGLFEAAPQLSCFWVIFGPSAIVLWLILGFWIGLFVALARLGLRRFGRLGGALLVPFLWTGIEYFRSELYYLRFSWLNVGYIFSDTALLPLFKWFGMYGLGFLAMAAAVGVSLLPLKRAAFFIMRVALVVMLVLFLRAYGVSERATAPPGKPVRVAGVQLEFPIDAEARAALDRVLQAHPEAELLILSEYTFDGLVPEKIKTWCRNRQRYLVVGGKDPAPKANFYDTAYVVGPSGEIVFRQVKSVPIQFFRDGLPAPEQKLWDSPWGKLGICICYDLRYTRVVDRLVRLGAQAILVPTMDVVDWGRREHELHARVAPVRSAEYGVPIFRVASSGVSQLVDHAGRVIAEAPYPGEGTMLSGRLEIGGAGSLPLDRWLAPLATGVMAAFLLWLLIRGAFGRPVEVLETKVKTGLLLLL